MIETNEAIALHQSKNIQICKSWLENFKTNSLYAFAVKKMENHQESSTQAMSHKGEQRNKYTMELKRKVINYAKENSYNGAARKFKIDCKRAREWVNQEDKVLKMKGK